MTHAPIHTDARNTKHARTANTLHSHTQHVHWKHTHALQLPSHKHRSDVHMHKTHKSVIHTHIWSHFRILFVHDSRAHKHLPNKHKEHTSANTTRSYRYITLISHMFTSTHAFTFSLSIFIQNVLTSILAHTYSHRHTRKRNIRGNKHNIRKHGYTQTDTTHDLHTFT